MNAHDFAELLDGREYRKEVTSEEAAVAKASNLLVVFGYSDDNMELLGFVDGEVGCYDGGTFYVDARGIRLPWNEDEPITEKEARAFFARESLPSIRLSALWGEKGSFSWAYRTTAIVFDRFIVMDDGEKYCEGLVIDCTELLQENETDG